ncbi:rna polymerase sigma factor : RNA polymerase sigma factor, sigma-70 family OS=Singulisphaera acidiphila (strain ATCC BAA-1392 / DSM 18658 / VKM B-2454 / MOB10) GN=Sinac_0328 PE=4 SV=1: Sigma70_r2 [Gemmata massiliana]|uniref:RNA polymerase sigma-70 region 2 domain-containing protein n=1 Tax=Gemmata massiliana TaxID=1210884 RepID=A0A6P2DDN5_9BACT|nr:rna polymerase sigma factor : RNA polymerase sigma factor, sigma-70 family OS=Singulisphaera acidiphila (strain ATCC BAA-1392 / DSM 18658 / VKM B-2454 / MOB10) GN=Sinac_0328 PE=4 SV=1: Sigma70_r2 [Gemmata massiliana]
MCVANRPLCRGPVTLPTHSVPVTAVPEAVLLERFAAGDEATLGDLFRRYRMVAYRVAYRLLGHEADALDAVQDGFVNALRNLDQFRGQSSFKTWLLRVVSNAAFDLGRRRKRNSRVSNEHIDHPLDQLRASELPADVRSAHRRGALVPGDHRRPQHLDRNRNDTESF